MRLVQNHDSFLPIELRAILGKQDPLPDLVVPPIPLPVPVLPSPVQVVFDIQILEPVLLPMAGLEDEEDPEEDEVMIVIDADEEKKDPEKDLGEPG